jgi:hypothetical protein
MSAAATESPHAASPLADRCALPAGFYHLTLVATFLAGADIRLRPVPGLPNFSLLELIVIPTALAMIMEMMLRPRMAASVRIYRRNRPLAWYVGYAGFASVVGLARSSDSLQAFHDLVPAFALYALVVVTVDTRARLTGLLVTCLAAAISCLGLALLQLATGGFYIVSRSENIESKLDLVGEAVSHAATGLLAHPNGLALYLLPVALFLVVGAWRGFGTHRRSSPALAIVLIATIIVLNLTYAKGVFAWLVAGVLFLALPRRLDRGRVWFARIVPVVGNAVLVWRSVDAFLQGELQ